MQPSSGNDVTAAQLARLQQQIAQAQYGQGQQQMMNANQLGGMGNAIQQQQQLQQAYMQQQLQQNNQQGMQQARRNSQLNPLTMMQQQQGNSQMTSANMSSFFNAFQSSGAGGAMDASSASGAQLAALAGMSMGGGSNMGNQSNNMLLGNRSTSQGQAQGIGNQPMPNAAQLKQQIAMLQRQLEQQQQSQNQAAMGMSGSMSSSNQSYGMQQQQQLFQQMQQQQMGGDQFSMAAMMQRQNTSMQQQRDSWQQQQLKIQNDVFEQQQNNNDLIGRRSSVTSLDQSGNLGTTFNNFDMDGSTNSHRSSSLDTGSGDKPDESGTNQKSFLDGTFAGGWQSNADLPDRRRIIFSILEVIRQMRPDTNKISQKLPHMAKSLEEHLYRSAQTKEEYLDSSTLKKRLQLIAHGLELHRSTSSESANGVGGISNSQTSNSDLTGNNAPLESQQLQQYLQMNSPDQMGMSGNFTGMGLSGSMSGQTSVAGGNDTSIGIGGGISDSYDDSTILQKKKVIKQQQQRLLLLRHASKCKEGPNCKTKFCKQMTELWHHMKQCRDKNCTTAHCLSSRCVLNHYRYCKVQGKTNTCEVCGPVMEKIKRQDEESMDSSDPLAATPDPGLPQLQPQISNFNIIQSQNDPQVLQQQAMQQIYQNQQLALNQQQNQAMGLAESGMDVIDNSSMSGLGMSFQNDALQHAQGSQQQDMANLRTKFQQQQQLLLQLQQQQAKLVEQQQLLQEQQRSLADPQTMQGQQIQQQYGLLQRLQTHCQQQHALAQQQLLMTYKEIQQVQMKQQMNTSQSSHHSSSHHSQQSHASARGSNNSVQLQAQMEVLSQNHKEAVSNNEDTLIEVPSEDQADLELIQQALEGPDENLTDPIKSEDPSQPPDDSDTPDEAVPSSTDDTFNNIAKELEESEEKEEEEEEKPTARTLPVAKSTGGRGRGGKGKRLRDIADDLLPAGSAAAVKAGGALSFPFSDGASESKKRSADELGDSADEPAQKTSRTDSGALDPDGETSGDPKDATVGSDGNGEDSEPSASLSSSLPKGDVEQNLMLLHKGLHLTSRTITHKYLPIVQQLIDDPFGWVFRDAVDPVVFGLPDYFEVVKNPMHLLLVKKKLENAVYTDMASFERDVKLVFENAILYNGEESEVGQLAQQMMGVFEKEYKKVCEGVSINQRVIDSKPCKLCGRHNRQFEPPVLYCAGMSCGIERIKRNATYYTYGSNQNCWCQDCYGSFKPNQIITLDDGSEIMKSRLMRSKHDSLPEEVWIECDRCKSRVHQICALHNSRMSKPNSIFWCPDCVESKTSVDESPKMDALGAKDLPTCTMSDFMEKGLQKSLTAAYEGKAKETNVRIDDIEKANGLCIRVLSHVEKKHVVRDEMFKRYSPSGYPSDFPVHTKCMGLFQSIDGVDVLLFVMYVYEYGENCPPPNRRRVYISYIDSIQYFQPKAYRSIAYQSMIMEYLRFVRKRGFHTCHIWSCPPAPDDEYVFYCHPSHQKIPQEEALRNWYYKILDKAKAEGVVLEVTNFHDEYFKNEGEESPIGSAADPTALPYFEGDYIPGEIEKIISQMPRSETSLDSESATVGKKGGLKLGTRSNPGQLVNQKQDKVMLRLGKTMYNMRENFMVVRLRSKRFVASVDRGEDVSNWTDDDEFRPLGKDAKVLNHMSDIERGGDGFKNESKTNDHALADLEVLSGKLADARKSFEQVGNTLDEDMQFESELFENRQLMLNYCQTNHFQFDELRRAKHSTLMVLYQLHNPTAPKFVQQCGACHRDIADGARFMCNSCSNFNFCQACYRSFKSGVLFSQGSKFTHDSTHTFSQISVVSQQKQAEQSKSLQGYLQILIHAADCSGPPACKIVNCQKMKTLIGHVRTCEVTHRRGCKICSRLLSLIIVHARSCTSRGSCSLPFCDRIRERNERIRRQQQLMDDRRRQAQNEFYRSSDE